MFKFAFKGLVVAMGVIFMSGCASKSVEVRRYVEVKDRVDQNMDGGNAGFLGGTPQPEDRSKIRKTRKIYVVEVTKGDLPEEPVVIEDATSSEPAGYETAGYEDDHDYSYDQDNTIEVSRDDAMRYDEAVYAGDRDEPVKRSGSVEYTVLKDDTLQKISKKFYDSYSKWPKIYDANRDVIDNPDRIKPGIVLRIPSL